MVDCIFLSIALVLGAQASSPQAEDPPALVLEGVVVTRNPGSALALVRPRGSSRAQAVRVGQAIAGFVLADVARDSALFSSAARPAVRVFLRGAEPSIPPPVDAELWERRELDRVAAKARLEREIPVILVETRLTPRVKEGEVRGLSLGRLPDGTLLSESGLVPGDVLLSLNGEPLHSLTELWAVLGRLAQTEVDELRLVVERKGEELRLAYALTR